MGKEEARVRDKIREHYPDAKQAFHAFNTNKDGRLSEEEFMKGIDSVFGEHEKLPLAIKTRLMRRADLDGDGFLAYHEFLGRFGVKPVMRQAINLEKKIAVALQRLFPDSLQKAFDWFDQGSKGKLTRDDMKKGIREVLKIKEDQADDDEVRAFLD